MKQDFKFKMNCRSENVICMKVYVNQSKNEIMMNVVVIVKNQMIGVLAKMIICGTLVRVLVNVMMHIKLTNIYILKLLCEKCLFGKLILAYANKILNTVETTLVDKKETCEKNYSLIYTILSVIILLFLLVVIFLSRYNYCTKDWVRKENSLSHQDEINNVKEIYIKNRTCYFFDDMINTKIRHLNKIRIDKKSYKNILIYYAVYATSNSVKPLLSINKCVH